MKTNYNKRREPKRKEKWFSENRYPHLLAVLLKANDKKKHNLVLQSRWNQRIKDCNEVFICANGCGMEAYIQMTPPMGYENLHGNALYIPCTKLPKEF